MSMDDWNGYRQQLFAGVGDQATLSAERPAGKPAVESIKDVPAACFCLVLGLAGLGHAWSGTARPWKLPDFVEQYLYMAAGLVWTVLIVSYALKAMFARLTG
jgi:hypothetical protein